MGPSGPELLRRGFMITHNDAPQSVGLLWTSDSLDAQNSENTQHSQETEIHGPGGIRTHNPSKRATEDPRLSPRGHWDRHNANIDLCKSGRNGFVCIAERSAG